MADAYFNRGSYTSALKAYDKVLTLVSSDEGHGLYPQLQISTITGVRANYWRTYSEMLVIYAGYYTDAKF